MSNAATQQKRAPARPTTINVAGRPWTVEWMGLDDFKRQPGLDDDNVCGATYGQDLRIIIGTWQAEHIQKENLLHEVLHAIMRGGCFDGELSDDLDAEEWMFSGLDSPLLTTLRANPKMLAWLLS